MSELNFGRLVRRANLFADEPAIHDLGTGHRATYAEHIERLGRHCAVLSELGVKPNDRVGVLAVASHTYFELWHSLLAGAGVINPLNSRLSVDELTYVLRDSDTAVVYVDDDGARAIAQARPQLPDLRTVVLIGDGDGPHDERLDDLMASASDAGLPEEPDEHAVATLLYTGGTTGRPKGVVHTQRSIVTAVYRFLISARITPGTRYLAYMPLFHIGSLASWGAIVPVGGEIVLLPQFEPGLVNDAIRTEEITMITAVPTMLAMILRHDSFDPDSFEALDLITYGAAPMPPELLEQAMRAAPRARFWQGYGMTESPIVCCLAAEDHTGDSGLLGSVGRPAVGVDVEIRHPESGMPLAPGEMGEIWVRSDGVMREYWRKPDQTDGSLLDGFYRTGDAGRLDNRGYLFLGDRIKDMIVTGGENVYSLEVENAVGSHPAVQHVAVVGVPDAVWGEAVHAYVVCDPTSVTPAELEHHARQTIAGYKVPKTWTLQTDPLPLSAAGKVLKRALREQHT